MSFAVKDRVLSRIISGPEKDTWIPCIVDKVNNDGTYGLKILNPEKYKTYAFADSVDGSLLRKDRLGCIASCLPKDGYDKVEDQQHILMKIPRERDGPWDKVTWYWQRYPGVMKAVRSAAVAKVRGYFKKFDKEIINYKWTSAEMKSEVFTGIYNRKEKNKSKMSWKLTYHMPARKDIPVLDLIKKTMFDNYQRALADTRYEFELLDAWTLKEKNGPDIRIQITSEKMRFPLISDRYATSIIAVREDKTGFVRVEASIKHPLKKDEKSLVRSKFENYNEHRLLKDGSLQNTVFIDADIGGSVPKILVNKCFPRILNVYSKFLIQFKEYDFSKDTDWNRYYELIGSTDKR